MEPQFNQKVRNIKKPYPFRRKPICKLHLIVLGIQTQIPMQMQIQIQIQMHMFPPHLKRSPPFLPTGVFKVHYLYYKYTQLLLSFFLKHQLLSISSSYNLQLQHFNRASIQKKFLIFCENSGNACLSKRNVKIYEKGEKPWGRLS